jgi:hypothetical protein
VLSARPDLCQEIENAIRQAAAVSGAKPSSIEIETEEGEEDDL